MSKRRMKVSKRRMKVSKRRMKVSKRRMKVSKRRMKVSKRRMKVSKRRVFLNNKNKQKFTSGMYHGGSGAQGHVDLKHLLGEIKVGSPVIVHVGEDISIKGELVYIDSESCIVLYLDKDELGRPRAVSHDTFGIQMVEPIKLNDVFKCDLPPTLGEYDYLATVIGYEERTSHYKSDYLRNPRDGNTENISFDDLNRLNVNLKSIHEGGPELMSLPYQPNLLFIQGEEDVMKAKRALLKKNKKKKKKAVKVESRLYQPTKSSQSALDYAKAAREDRTNKLDSFRFG